MFIIYISLCLFIGCVYKHRPELDIYIDIIDIYVKENAYKIENIVWGSQEESVRQMSLAHQKITAVVSPFDKCHWVCGESIILVCENFRFVKKFDFHQSDEIF